MKIALTPMEKFRAAEDRENHAGARCQGRRGAQAGADPGHALVAQPASRHLAGPSFLCRVEGPC